MRRAFSNRLLGAVQFALLTSGCGLLAVYAFSRVQSAAGSAEGLEAFDRARQALLADASTQAVPELVGNSSLAAERQTSAGGGVADLGADGAAALQLAEAEAAMLPAVDSPDQSLWGQARIDAFRDSLAAPAREPVGVLRVPSIDLVVPVFAGTSDWALNRGVGWIEGTPAPGSDGNIGIAGHRDGFFRGLKDLQVGDVLEVQSLTETTRYRITELFVVEPTDVYVLDPTDRPTVTLVTCYPFYFVGSAPQRYIVKGVAEG